MGFRIEGAHALVTGANRGLGRAYVAALVERGATVYGAARDPGAITTPGVTPVRLDITDAVQIEEAVRRCGDVDLLINNAGTMHEVPLLTGADPSAAETDMRTNYFGTLAMCRAFAPVLRANGGGALVNVLSVVSWFANPYNGGYGASKSAEWALTNAARLELRSQGTLVVGVFAGFIDTEMAANASVEKISPESVVEQTLDGLEAGAEEVLTSGRVRALKEAIPDDLTRIYPAQQEAWDTGRGWGR